MLPFSLAVVGADYPNKSGPGRRFEIAMCIPGEPVDLRPEPDNPADERAVAVWSARGICIGYVTAERAARVGQLLRSGREWAAVFQEPAAWGAVIRIAFDGERPVLPEPAPAASVQWAEGVDSDPDWMPDEDWPE